MITKIHFISGLPRSGSTLLSALLLQNPRFHASVTSPVITLCQSLQGQMSGGEFDVFFDNARRAAVLRGVFEAYYHDMPPGRVIFDTNRSWTGRAALLAELFPAARIICCVRDVARVVDSLEHMLNQNPLQLSSIFKFQPGSSVYSRAESLLNVDTGLVGRALSTLREAWFNDFAATLLMVPYENLTREPERVLRGLYAELGEEPFAHDFEHVAYESPEYDARLGMPGLHTVRGPVRHREGQSGLPTELFAKLSAMSFWQQPGANVRGVKIL